ncbi:hypothetical protein Halru_0907 [Halovivax ruber XH-70]|uniref:HdeD family acid-resistance protein n=1 Tax=Halovivax ruber (strain DSM 18193 / JCM 13892 / XH-70) TaxID=797302 RepID=L0I9M2_HALRX|nr:DUF308 domain-containing protein [Halovivax ruber]AGB15528.1 hypothetical protein Halru_0907 [Halovivax ruber XH-70]
MSTITPGTEESIETNWRPLAIAGGLIAVLGLIAAALPFGTGIALAYVLGAALLVGGVVHAGHAFTTDGWAGSLWQAALAGVTIVAGLLILANPLIGLASLTLLAIAYLLVDGLTEVVASLRMGSGSGRGWVAASGVLSLVLAGLLWAGFPVDAVWVVGVLVGASLFVTGVSMIAVAYGTRRMERHVPEPGEKSRGV